MSAAGTKVLGVAKGEVGNREQPDGSNKGPKVNVYKAETWLPASEGWPWCVAFWQWCIHHGLGKKFPYPTAAVEQLEDYARSHKLHTSHPEVGDAACFHGDHITFVASVVGSEFQGLGGNQGNMVKVSSYSRAGVSTFVSTAQVRIHLGLPPVTVKRPRYEVVRGEGGQKKTIYLGSSIDKAMGRAERALRAGAGVVKVKKAKPAA